MIGVTARLWRSLATFMRRYCPEWFKLAQIALLMIVGSAEDERTFSALNFIMSDLRSRLETPHLTVAVRLFLCRSFTVRNFPYDEAMEHWHVAV